MRSAFAVTTPLVLLLGMGVADAADPTQLAETGGFLLGNASRCGVSAERVESAGKVIHDFIAAAARDSSEAAATSAGCNPSVARCFRASQLNRSLFSSRARSLLDLSRPRPGVRL